jgi:broad specificity phosphatase PhoE
LTRLLLIRHAQSEWNALGRWQGLADPDLSELGRTEATVVAARLAGLGLRRVISSDLRRAAQTADIIAETLGTGPIERMSALREIDVGRWSGLTRAQIEEGWPGAIERWRRGEDVGNDGEDRNVFRERIVATVASLAAGNTDPVLVVTHAGAIAAVETHLGVHPGRPVGRLFGRWFTHDGELRADGDRIVFIDADG